jgi:hypothetical protein
MSRSQGVLAMLASAGLLFSLSVHGRKAQAMMVFMVRYIGRSEKIWAARLLPAKGKPGA